MKDLKHLKRFNESDENSNISNYSDNDYVKDLSSVIEEYRQEFFNKVQIDIQDVLGDKITKKLIYPDYIYYEINAKNRNFDGFFEIKFDKSEPGRYGDVFESLYCGIIYFDKNDVYEFFSKSSLIKILQNKQIL